MKQLLTDSKAALQAALSYVRNSDVYVTEDIRLVRSSGSYPAVGLKDGGIVYGTEASDQGDDTYSLIVCAYVELTRQEAGIMGAAGQKGVLDVAKDMVTTMKAAALSGRFDARRVTAQDGSEVIPLDGRAVTMVAVHMEFDIYE